MHFTFSLTNQAISLLKVKYDAISFASLIIHCWAKNNTI